MPVSSAKASKNDLPSGKLKQARAEATRAKIISVARVMFSVQGYYDSCIADIVAAAEVTRGSLYYHFAEKRDLFEAVFREVATEKFDKVVEAVEPLSHDRWNHFLEALKEDLRVSVSDPGYQRIVLIDGPAVLGWHVWNEIRSGRSGEITAAELERMMEDGIVKHLNAPLTAQLVMATLNEAALAVAKNKEGLKDTMDVLSAMVSGIRA